MAVSQPPKLSEMIRRKEQSLNRSKRVLKVQVTKEEMEEKDELFPWGGAVELGD